VDKTKSKRKILALVLITASATFILCMTGFRLYFGASFSLWGDIRTYAQARAVIDKNYVGDYEESDVTDASIAAAVGALDDDWSYYMTADQYQAYLKRMENSFDGIGISYIRDEQTREIQVSTVTLGSPAEQAGIVTGDWILEIDGQSVSELDSEAISTLISEKLGSTVMLRVRDEAGAERDVEVASESFQVAPVVYELLEDGIGYIQIANFNANSAENAIAAIEDLRSQGCAALIFDVRDNPGGSVQELLNLLDYILPEGEMFVTVDKDGNKKIDTSDAQSVEMPMAVLVNENSYSAAEFFPAILQAYDWAEIVGEPTTGKGRSQITVRLHDGSAIHISSKRYFMPGGVDLSETGGMVPDYVVENDGETDLQLEKAVSLFK